MWCMVIWAVIRNIIVIETAYNLQQQKWIAKIRVRMSESQKGMWTGKVTETQRPGDKERQKDGGAKHKKRLPKMVDRIS